MAEAEQAVGDEVEVEVLPGQDLLPSEEDQTEEGGNLKADLSLVTEAIDSGVEALEGRLRDKTGHNHRIQVEHADAERMADSASRTRKRNPSRSSAS